MPGVKNGDRLLQLVQKGEHQRLEGASLIGRQLFETAGTSLQTRPKRFRLGQTVFSENASRLAKTDEQDFELILQRS